MKKIQFTFENNLQELNLDTLKRTYKEETVLGEALNGIHHYEAIERIQQLLDKHSLKYELHKMFAAQNSSKKEPAVVINPRLEQEFGKGSPEAHVLRRVYTTMHISNGETEETTTGLVISFNNNGLQFAIGPNVKICTNQCILSASRMVSTYGTNGIKEMDKVFDVVDDWMHNFNEHREQDLKVIEMMKTIKVPYQRTMELIGRLNVMRVLHDTTNVRLREKAPKDYPLNQGQISSFTEDFLKHCLTTEKPDHSLWEIYNLATELYKPGVTDIPNIISQGVVWSQFLINEFGLN